MSEEGLSFLSYKTPIFGPPWQIPIEFPILQATAAFLTNQGVFNLDLACKVTALAYFYLSALFLFLLCDFYFKSRWVSFSIVLFYLWTPYTIIWSRRFYIDHAAIAFALAYLYFFLRWLKDSKRWYLYILAVACGCLGYLTKFTTMPGVVIPIGYFAVAHLFENARKDASHANVMRGLYGFVTQQKRFFIALICSILIPLLVGCAWTAHVENIVAGSRWTAFHSSKYLRWWVFGTWSQKLNPVNWVKIFAFWADYVTPGINLLLFSSIGLYCVRRYSRETRGFVYSMFVAALLTIFMFFNVISVHHHYYIASMPAIAIVVGVGIYHVFVTAYKRSKVVLGMVVCLLMLSFVKEEPWEAWKRELNFSFEDLTYNGWDYQAAMLLKRVTAPDDYVVVADHDWSPEVLYYARRKGFMLWKFESKECNDFLKAHGFSMVVCKEEHPLLFSNWRHRRKLGEVRSHAVGSYKIYHVFDGPLCTPLEAESQVDQTRFYEWGSDITFSEYIKSGFLGSVYQGEGWNAPERSFTWTVAREASLTMLVCEPESDIELTAEFRPFIVPGKLDRQRVNLFVNGENVGSWMVESHSEDWRAMETRRFLSRSVVIPKDLIKGSAMEIMLELPDAVSPMELGLSGDARLLGIAMRKMVATCLGDTLEK
jgi:hypothetical protein